MTVASSDYNSGCLFCPALGDRGLVNHHLNKFIPLLVSKLKSIPRAVSDDFHPPAIVTAARYDKQSASTRSLIADGEWERPGLAEWVVLIEFGKHAVVPLLGTAALKKHKTRAEIARSWWEQKVAEAVKQNGVGGFNLDRFIKDVMAEAHALWYPGEAEKEPTEQISKPSAYISARTAAIIMDPESSAGTGAGKRRGRGREQKKVKKQKDSDICKEAGSKGGGTKVKEDVDLGPTL